ncbi:curli assembly protein CsgF [Methylobacterium sp. WL69]|nr:curli assembly protein CsgF [Methylobacterium sp. WL69]TXM73014.1 curli assembly protein CsgF [Methylobacterium sp. WL69]
MPLRPSSLALLGLSALAMPVSASPLNYQPVNPSFGGSPLNGNWLQSQATAQNIFVRKRQLADTVAQQIAQQQQQANNTPSTASNFAAVINARLLAAVADRITNAIFGENAQQSGTFVVQGTTIQFQQAGPNVQITVNDGATVSTVTVPLGF